MKFRTDYVCQKNFQIDLKIFFHHFEKKSRFFFENPQNPKNLKKKIFIKFLRFFGFWGFSKKKSWKKNFFFKVMNFFFKIDSKKVLDHIGDAELSELSIAHGFGAIRAHTKTLRPRNRFFGRVTWNDFVIFTFCLAGSQILGGQISMMRTYIGNCIRESF